MRHGAEWYKREPVAYLGGVQGLTAREHAVYSVVLDLIYQHGGSVNNDPKWIAGWFSDMGAAAVRATIDALVERGKLEICGDQLTQKRAKNQAETKEKLRENRVETGRKGGISSGKSRANSNKNNDISEAKGSTREEKIREEKKEDTNVSSQKGSRLPADWVLPKPWGEWALAEGMDEVSVRREADRFADYWRGVSGKQGVKLDWQATWRNWVRKAIDLRKPQKPSQAQATNFGAFGHIPEVG